MINENGKIRKKLFSLFFILFSFFNFFVSQHTCGLGVNHTREYTLWYMNDPVMSVGSSPDTPESWSGFFLYLVLAGIIALTVRTYLIAPYIVVGASMEPTFEQYHYLLIDMFTYRYHEPERGDVLVLDLPQNESRALIKRLIGLPGETIRIENNTVHIVNENHPEGFTLSEPYLATENAGGPVGTTVALKPGEYFVLGDNRRVSSDSRVWGVLPARDIVGRVAVRLYPFSLISLFPGKSYY